MKILWTPKVISVLILGVAIIGSYILNSSNTQESVIVKTEPKGESVEEYNKRKKAEAESSKKSAASQKTSLTIDGRDPATGDIIDPLNLWANYETRTYARKVGHGEIVTLIKREGDGVLIETESGQRGWITYFFIKEYK
ncbi:MAG TPA: hypothetical protein VGK59_16320 [Ohtaekwangia sp.]